MYWKKNFSLIVLIGLAFLVGSLCIILDAAFIIRIILYSIAVLLIFVAATCIATVRQYVGPDKTQLIIQACVLVLAAISIFIVDHRIVRIVLGSVFLLYTIIQLLNADNKKEKLQKDFWKYIIAIVLILSIDSIIKITVTITGVLFIIVGSWLLYILLNNRKNPKCPNILYDTLLVYYMKKGAKGQWEL